MREDGRAVGELAPPRDQDKETEEEKRRGKEVSSVRFDPRSAPRGPVPNKYERRKRRTWTGTYMSKCQTIRGKLAGSSKQRADRGSHDRLRARRASDELETRRVEVPSAERACT